MTTLPPAPNVPPCPRVCFFKHAWGPWLRYPLIRKGSTTPYAWRKSRACTYCDVDEDVPDPQLNGH